MSMPATTTGLTAEEVAARVAAGASNEVTHHSSRPTREILRANLATRFNAILGVLLVVILVVGPPQDALFGVVLVANAAIGIVQELRAKWTLDRLALLGAAEVVVVRDGAAVRIPRQEVVVDDLLRIGPGDEVVVDAVVTDAAALEVDEALLTGESEAVAKCIGEEVLSGSFVVGGSGLARAVRVGDDSHAATLQHEAQRFSLVRSELRAGIDRILRVLTWVLVPAAALLVSSQVVTHESVHDAVRGTVAGVGAMIPEGLVLLTSVAFAVGVVRLGRQRVLVDELAAIEQLARVDVLCLDKTGTLTEGRLDVARIEALEATSARATAAAGALAAADPAPNASLAAIGDACPDPGWIVEARVPFSSARKWSAIDAGEQGTWFLGAPEVLAPTIVDGGAEQLVARVETLARSGRRVLLLGRTPCLDGEEMPRGLEPAALVVLEERIRADAADTVRWFAAQGVSLRVISGDHPATVGAVADRVGVDQGAGVLDARSLPDDPDELGGVLDRHLVYGRVTPAQKQGMVAALQARGHVVAMVGDGVNDVLALKQADLGIAMGSGSPAASAVGRVVLLDDSVARLPAVVAEGRRVIANVERVANLFVTKSVYAALLALAVGVARLPFPFYPRHLTIVSSLTIGIPAFALALAPNETRSRPGFVGRVARFAIPAGSVAAATTFLAYAVARNAPGGTLTEARTVATTVLFGVAAWVLGILTRPYTPLRLALVGSVVATFVCVLGTPWLRTLFALELPPPVGILVAAGCTAAGCAALEIGWRITGGPSGLAVRR